MASETRADSRAVPCRAGAVALTAGALLGGIGSVSPVGPAAQSSHRPDSSRVTAFVGVSVVPMDREGVLEGQTVIVRDGRVVGIGPVATTVVPPGAIRVDGRGKYLLPGLTDMHTHLREDEAENQAQLRLFLANGVTTILSLRGTPAHLDLRRRVASGQLLGPTIYTSGPFVNEPDFKTPDEVERAVVEQKRAGYDFIKMHGTLSRAAYQRLFEAARREGIRVVGHAPRNLPFMVVPAEHQDAVAHAEEFVYTYFDFRFDHPQDPDTLAGKVAYIAEATARAGVSVIPTLVAFRTIMRQVEDICGVLARPEVKYVPPGMLKTWLPQSNRYIKSFKQSDVKTFRAMYRLQEQLVKALQAAGARLLAGTDASIPAVVPGTSLHEELRNFVAAGLTPYEALRAATYNAADFLKGLDEFGTVAAGKRADLLLVDGNPLERIENTSRVSGVMVRGHWLGKSELQGTLDSLAASHPREARAVPASALAQPGTPLRVVPGTAGSSATAFVDVNVLPMDSARVLEGQTVVVRDGRIAAIGPSRTTAIPRDATRIEAKGRYLLPGLAEMHAHLVENDDDNRAFLEQYLANGVTTILNLRGSPGHLALRDQVARGDVVGPTIYTSGPYVNEPFATTPDEVERAVVEQKRAGYDFVKMHGDLTREAYHRLFEVARREGIRVFGHAPRNLPFEAMVEERQEMVVHVEEYLYVYFRDPMKDGHDLEERTGRIPYMAKSVVQAGTWLTPTLTVFRGLPEQVDDICGVMARPEMKYVQPRVAENWIPANNSYLDRFAPEDAKRLWRQYAYLEKVVKGFHDAGVRLLAGTDPPVPLVVAGFALHLELKFLVAAGLTPYEALRAATYNPADFLHRLNESGTVAVGKRADLLLLDGNPLTDIGNTLRRAGVMLGGRWLPQAELQKLLDDRAAAYTAAGSGK